ncbi:hypothetical protein BBO99_00006675 [Phytophthora kernoviae]|uniref:Uncharacterized protein n=1 Tax=Phytophthora kernoviae TaxID=325452 RepID=A0A3R7GPC4_9STRA|nr:hypothetical protein BBI17_009308 [Phytophthora kernoviae]RLN77524.1 hypothetical protein BBO99_00006675 [Phytophthora kernoviae]
MTRGGGLRVGRIVSDARDSNNSNLENQYSSLFVQEEERRVQDELIEMLTVKLANKEKEMEMLKVKQSDIDRELGGYDHQMQQQQEEHTRVVTEMTTTNQELQRQVQILQIQCEQTLKGANTRAADVEKKRSKLSRVEDKLTQQLEELRKENVELKVRKGQMSSQTKHLQARIAALENAYATQERKLEDVVVELENTRKYCRDCQFRTKQLQEEIVFLKNRKITTDAPNPATESADKDSPAPESPLAPQAIEAKPETDDEVPCWMKG